MDNVEVLRKDALWIKSCELSKLFLKIINILDGSTYLAETELQACKKLVGLIPVYISKSVVSSSLYDQMRFYGLILIKSREVDEKLYKLYETVTSVNKTAETSELIAAIFSAFIFSDQLREMILNMQNDMEVLKKLS